MIVLGLGLAIGLGGCAGHTPAATTPGAYGADFLAITGATIWPAPEAAAIADGVVLIADGHIRAVGPRAAVEIPPGTRVLDARGLYLVAGYWNSHVHFTSAAFERAATRPAGELKAALTAMLTRWGFTSVFDIGSDPDNTVALRGRVDGGELPGPHIRYTGATVFTRGGIPFYLHDLEREMAKRGLHLDQIGNAEEALALVRAQLDAGADGIKLFTGAPVGDRRVVVMPVPAVQAATDEAHRRHRPVFAHPQSVEGVRAAIAGGVDVVAHTTAFGGDWDDALVADLVARHMAVVPTLTLWRVEAGRAGLPAEEGRAVQERGVGQLRRFAAAGGEVLYGTDIDYQPEYDPREELAAMARAGLDAPALLRALTTAPSARFTGLPARVAPDAAADLVLLTRDPRQDSAAFTAVRYTLRAGRIIYDSERAARK